MTSSGASMRFEVRNGTKSGIFWQTEASKQKSRKFGYKSKGLRHPIRKPEAPTMPESAHTKKSSKDFIKKNREHFQHPKPEDNHSGHTRSSEKLSTHIKPGTVTLTQDQLNSLLASVGKLKPGDVSHVRISIDADTNEIQFESPRADQETIRNSVSSDNEKEVEREASLFDLVDKKELNDKQNQPTRDRTFERPAATKEVHFNTGFSETAKLSEPQPAPSVPPPIPWKHLTVAERKRMQWERERAAAAATQKEEMYDPWGRPGAGAPLRHLEQKEIKKTSNEQEQQDQAVDDIEAKYRAFFGSKEAEHHEDKKKKNEKKSRLQKESHSNEEEATSHLEKKGNRRPVFNQDQKKDGKEQKGDREEWKRERKGKQDERIEDKKGEGKDLKTSAKEKRDKRSEERREENKETKGDERLSRREDLSRIRDDAATRVGKRETEKSEAMSIKLPDVYSTAPAAMQTSLKIGEAEPDSRDFISKKEEERRKWLEELDRQREEKRLEKQREQERRRKGIDDTWADRFVHENVHKAHVTPQPPQLPPSTQQAPGTTEFRTGIKFQNTSTNASSQDLPPPAMRASILIGEAAPQNDHIKSKQEEEKRMWLEELNKQREEQQLARLRLKEKQQASEETWADRFTQDTRSAPNHFNSQLAAPLTTDPAQHLAHADLSSGHFSSALQPQDAVTQDDSEPRSFLRGQNVYVDPVTRKELEIKRKQYLEYQAAIKSQIEEKARLKRQEHERKWMEDAEEEQRLAVEREHFQRQLMAEQNKLRQKEEARQKQVEELKHMMDTEKERAQEQRMIKRLATLKQAGHDVSSLKAHYDAITPRLQHVAVDPATVPGLSLLSHDHGNILVPDSMPSVSRSNEVFPDVHSQETASQPASHHPYIENRVLTPSRYRKPSQTRSDPNSPRREFATQTEEELGLALPRESSEVDIEYRAKPTRKQVQVKSAETHRVHEQKSASLSSKQQRSANKDARSKGKVPSWNYQNQKRKPTIRQSEKELLLEQKQQQSQERRAKRERQLKYLVELNKHITPSDKRSPRDRSPGHHLEIEGEEKGNEPEHPRGRELRRRSSPVSSTEVTHRPGSPASRAAKSQPSRSRSPPVPAVRHKVGKNPAENFEADYNTSAHNDKHHHIAEPDLDDKGNIRVPARETDFIPIMRTADVLDPFRAEEPILLSRESSHITRARQRYHKNLHPGDYGGHLDVHNERQRHPVPTGKDPILNPNLVKEHPTARQDLILKQLSTLKQNLIQRQRELETYMSSSDFEKQV